TAEQFAVTFEEIIQPITAEDEIVVLADIVGGSPLTTALNVLGNKGYLANTVVMGGMNLPLALTTVLMKDNLPNDVLVPTALGEATTALQQFVLATSNDDEDEI
ncbi:MAG: PTS fructose transporter subunit IIA, partial [Erysipelotrichaceae bacterium]|nr:PTS fructose transporter subunit IIA [Erysipelotrichaceae bacterium]